MRVRFGDCELDLDRHELRRGGDPVAIEPQALRILIALVERRGSMVTKNELLDAVWGDRFVSESALTTQIKGLRRAVGDSGKDQHTVRTVHGRGYVFVAPMVEDDGASSPGEHEMEPGDAPSRSNPVVAVLPFADLSVDGSQRHVADGLTHDLIAALSRHRWLRVLTRAVAATVASDPDPLARLADDFGVGYVVEGSVRRDGERMRVTATLTDTTTGTVRWTERFDRGAADIFDVLDEITEVTAASVEPEVGYAERERTERAPRSDLQAWDLFHLGLGHFYRFTAADNLEAQRLFAECRRIDPGLADAHAWWAYAVVLGMTYWDVEPERATLDDALEAAGRALALDDRNAVFHMLRGRVRLARREYAEALDDNTRAIQLNPSFAAAYCGLGDSLNYEGRYDEALEQFGRSISLGAHDPQRWAFLSYGALAMLFAERYEEALDWARRASAIPNCQYWTSAHEVVALGHLGRVDEAARAVASLMRQRPDFTIEHARHKLFYLKRPEQLELYLAGLRAAGVPEG